MKEVPIIILCHNNEYYVKNTLNQLEKYHNNFIILDNNSTDLDTKKYLDKVSEKYIVIYNKENFRPKDCIHKLYNILPDYFCFTDPDLEFNENLPKNFIECLIKISNDHNSNKVGFALKISDYDKMYQSKKYLDHLNIVGYNIHDWEINHWKNKIEDPNYELYEATIDTTFSLYNKKINPQITSDNILTVKQIRVAGDFTCRHLPWYPDHNNKIDKNILDKMYVNSKWSTVFNLIYK
jgi:hypothetical protein